MGAAKHLAMTGQSSQLVDRRIDEEVLFPYLAPSERRPKMRHWRAWNSRFSTVIRATCKESATIIARRQLGHGHMKEITVDERVTPKLDDRVKALAAEGPIEVAVRILAIQAEMKRLQLEDPRLLNLRGWDLAIAQMAARDLGIKLVFNKKSGYVAGLILPKA